MRIVDFLTKLNYMNTKQASALRTEILNLTKDEVLAQLNQAGHADPQALEVLTKLGLTGTAQRETYIMLPLGDLGFREGSETTAKSIYDESMLKREGLELCGTDDVASILLGTHAVPNGLIHIPVKNPQGGWVVFSIEQTSAGLRCEVSFRPVSLQVAWRIDMIHVFRFSGPVS